MAWPRIPAARTALDPDIMVQLLRPEQNAGHHRDLVQRYRSLCDLDGGMTPQERGTAFNQLLADALGRYGVRTRVGRQTSSGEIDVAFKLGNTRFILEAKWQEAKINYAPLALLDARTLQRLEGTLGIFVSMSGYTRPAVEQVPRSGGRTRMVLFDAGHVEALIAGLMSPEELIDSALEEAAASGLVYAPMSALMSPHGHSSPPPVRFGPPPTYTGALVDDPPDSVVADIVLHSTEEIRGIATRNGNLLIAFPDGLAEVDLNRQTSTWKFALRSIDRNPLIDTEGRIYVLRGAAVARMDGNDSVRVIAGGFGDASTLLAGPAGFPWVLDPGAADPGSGEQSAELVGIGARLGDERRIRLRRYPAVAARNAIALNERRIFVLGSPHSAIVDLDEPPAERWVPTDITNPQGLASMDDGKIIAVCDKAGVTAIVIDPETGRMADLVSMNLSGSVSEAARDHSGLYVHSHAPVNGPPAPVIVKISSAGGVLNTDPPHKQATPVGAQSADTAARGAIPDEQDHTASGHDTRSAQPESVAAFPDQSTADRNYGHTPIHPGGHRPVRLPVGIAVLSAAVLMIGMALVYPYVVGRSGNHPSGKTQPIASPSTAPTMVSPRTSASPSVRLRQMPTTLAQLSGRSWSGRVRVNPALVGGAHVSTHVVYSFDTVSTANTGDLVGKVFLEPSCSALLYFITERKADIVAAQNIKLPRPTSCKLSSATVSIGAPDANSRIRVYAADEKLGTVYSGTLQPSK